jgi:Ca2+-binding EF-hand superfamily protein
MIDIRKQLITCRTELREIFSELDTERTGVVEQQKFLSYLNESSDRLRQFEHVLEVRAQRIRVRA